MKKRLEGYLLPEVIDPEGRKSVCIQIPDDRNHILAFLGQLDMLSYWWTWERDTAKQGTEAARVWLSIVRDVRAQLDDGGGCGDGCVRYDEGCDCAMVLIDGVFYPAPGLDPRTSPAFLRPPNATSDPRCDAAASLVKWIRNWVDDMAETVSAIQIAVAFLSGIALANVATLFFDDVAIVIANALLDLGIATVVNSFTEEVYDDLNCIFFCVFQSDGSLTQAGFDTAYDRIQSEIGGDAAIVMGLLMQFSGYVTFNNAGALGLETGDCDECEECGGCDIWLAGERPASEWTRLVVPPGSNQTIYNAFNDRFEGVWSTQYGTGKAVLIEREINRTIIDMYFDIKSVGSRGHGAVQFLSNGTPFYTSFSQPGANTEGRVHFAFPAGVPVGTLTVNFTAATYEDDPGTLMWVTRIQICYA